MRQLDQRGTSTLAHMKYGGRISRRLSQEPDGVVIHDVDRRRKHTRKHTTSKKPIINLWATAAEQDQEMPSWIEDGGFAA